MNIKQLFLVVLCILSLNADAQDVHFSYYQFAPSTVNPALTGAYYGNIRATVLRRSQWFNVGADANDGFNTLNLLLDGNIPFGFKEGDWVSAGINLISENSGFLAEPTAGVTDFSRGFSGLSVAYHMTMGKKKASVLTFSAKYGSYSNAFNPNGEIITSNLLAGATSDIDLDNFRQSSPIQQGGNNFSENLNDLSIGFMYTTPVGKADDLRIGISSDHFLAPRFMANPPPVDPTDPNPPVIPPSALIGEQVNRRINAFVQYYTDLNSKLTF